MKRVSSLRSRAPFVIAWALLCVAEITPLDAQDRSGTLAGTIVDQVGKSIEGATVTVKAGGGSASGTATTDAEGHFSVSGLAAGTYSLEATSPGFARSTRLGVSVSVGVTQDVSITLKVDAISQSVSVQDTVVLAADTAPQGNTLDATSAKTEITSAVIQNFMAPVADFAEVIQQAPGAFSTNPNGIGLGQASRSSGASPTASTHLLSTGFLSKTPTLPRTIPGPVFPRSGLVPPTSTAARARRPISVRRTSAGPSI